jgi:ABC-type Fe3+-hydroxamate transport system substrate-binding protein
MTSIDATGVIFQPGTAPRRIVSLVPSLTEALFALGAGDLVVGVTSFCKEPAGRVARLPKVGGTKTPDVQAVVALNPDMVIASTEENREADVEALRAAGLSVFVTFFPTVPSALDGIDAIARMVGVDSETCSWLGESRTLVAAAKLRQVEPVAYFCPIWRRPYMVARSDTYMSDLLALAGGRSCFAVNAPAHYWSVDLTDLGPAAPDVILLPDEPYRFAPRHVSDFAPYPDVPAVAAGRIHFIDGRSLSWYGPRIPRALNTFTAIFDAIREKRPLQGVAHGSRK